MITRLLTKFQKASRLKRNFCMYRNLQKDIAKEINLNPASIEVLRSQFSELRELQRKFFYNVTEDSTVAFFRVRHQF